MAPAYFLKIDGIPGESLDPEHVGELELASFTWGEAAAPPDVPLEVSFTARVSRASPELFAACAGGRRIASVVLTARDTGDAGSGVRRWRFSDVVVSAYQSAAGEGEPVDQVTLSAASVEVLPLRPQAPLRFEIVRPDDLLNLELEAINLRLDAEEPANPALVVDDPARPARLIVDVPSADDCRDGLLQGVARSRRGGSGASAATASVRRTDVRPPRRRGTWPAGAGAAERRGSAGEPEPARVRRRRGRPDPVHDRGTARLVGPRAGRQPHRRDRGRCEGAGDRGGAGDPAARADGDRARAPVPARHLAERRGHLGPSCRAVHLAGPDRALAHAAGPAGRHGTGRALPGRDGSAPRDLVAGLRPGR